MGAALNPVLAVSGDIDHITVFIHDDPRRFDHQIIESGPVGIVLKRVVIRGLPDRHGSSDHLEHRIGIEFQRASLVGDHRRRRRILIAGGHLVKSQRTGPAIFRTDLNRAIGIQIVDPHLTEDIQGIAALQDESAIQRAVPLERQRRTLIHRERPGIGHRAGNRQIRSLNIQIAVVGDTGDHDRNLFAFRVGSQEPRHIQRGTGIHRIGGEAVVHLDVVQGDFAVAGHAEHAVIGQSIAGERISSVAAHHQGAGVVQPGLGYARRHGDVQRGPRTDLNCRSGTVHRNLMERDHGFIADRHIGSRNQMPGGQIAVHRLGQPGEDQRRIIAAVNHLAGSSGD